LNRTQAAESGTGVRDGWLGEDTLGLMSGREPDLIRKATTCGILSTVSSTPPEVCGVTPRDLLRGRFLPPTTCFAILSGLFCLRPVCTLVCEGCRNLVVTLWKPKVISVGASRRVRPDVTACAPRWRLKISFWSPHFQFTNRRMRMFITIPKARNMNSTDDPP